VDSVPTLPHNNPANSSFNVQFLASQHAAVDIF